MKILHLAGLGIPPMALTFGELPGWEILFNRNSSAVVLDGIA
jgi:hypothetical protein